MSRLSALRGCLCVCAAGRGWGMASTGAFVPQGDIPPLSQALLEGRTASASASQVIHMSHDCPPVTRLPPFTRARQRPQGSVPAVPQTSNTPVFEPRWVQELTKVSLSFSQPMALAKCFPCCAPLSVFASPFATTRAPYLLSTCDPCLHQTVAPYLLPSVPLAVQFVLSVLRWIFGYAE